MKNSSSAVLVKRLSASGWVTALVLLSLFVTSCTRIPNLYKGSSFSFQYPAGWKRDSRMMYPPFELQSKTRSFSVAFDCPERDPESGEPVASISFYVNKPIQQVWLEDQFLEIVDTFVQSGFEVLDKGEIKIDDQVANWLVYRDNRARRTVLEFYVVNDNNIMFRIQYTAKEEKFAQYRPAFETARGTMKLSRW